jgi:hypothetical protein
LFESGEGRIREMRDYHGGAAERCLGHRREEKIMRAKAILFPWRANAMALALGLAVIGFSASLAHPETNAAPNLPAVTQQATQQAAAPDFICHARPGAWCDLRDWRGFAQSFAHPGTK